METERDEVAKAVDVERSLEVVYLQEQNEKASTTRMNIVQPPKRVCAYLQDRLDQDAEMVSLMSSDRERERSGEMFEQAIHEMSAELVSVLAGGE